MKLKPKNWAKYQHYKNRLPPWIKLHHDILRDIDFMCLPIASKAIAPLLWLLASESKSGEFDADINVLMFRLHMTEKDIQSGLKPLIDKGFFVVASGVLAECKQLATTETETETETEKKSITPNGFDLFWNAYPKKEEKKGAEKIWARLKPDAELLAKILKSVESYKQSKKVLDGYVKMPTTWLNKGCWDDENGDVPVNRPEFRFFQDEWQQFNPSTGRYRTVDESKVPNQFKELA